MPQPDADDGLTRAQRQITDDGDRHDLPPGAGNAHVDRLVDAVDDGEDGRTLHALGAPAVVEVGGHPVRVDAVGGDHRVAGLGDEDAVAVEVEI